MMKQMMISLLVVLALLAGAVPTVGQDDCAFRFWSLDFLHYYDLTQLASQTSRLSLPTVLVEMMSVKHDMLDAYLTSGEDCAADLVNETLAWMNATEQGYIFFMGEAEGQASAKLLVADGYLEKVAAAYAELSDSELGSLVAVLGRALE